MGIREYIINNFKDENLEGLNDAIDEAVSDNAEMTLPGLGVFFEIFWKNCDSSKRKDICNVIYNSISKGN